MSYQHISIDTTKRHGQRLRQGLDMIEQGLAMTNEEVNAMPFMLDGSDYTHLESEFGFEAGKGQTAKAELESMMGKLNSDLEQTNIHAAMQQVFNFFA